MIVLLVVMNGCGADTGLKLVPVTGTVRLDGQPLPRGSITLRPESSKDGWEQPTGSIEADGMYAVYTQGRAGAPPGRYRVVIFATGSPVDQNGAAHPGLPVSLIPAMYNDPAQTPLKVDVAPGVKTQFDWELTTHAKR
ncbi:MAG: hypothetical protein Q8K78_13555 [Planctomycetaceae bacterium]|nr:hypothetical protein [Planctomycetaceae bacterium]